MDNKKVKVRFTFIDLLIIIAVVGVIGFGVFKLMDFKPPLENKMADLVLFNEKVGIEEVPNFSAGDRVYINDVSIDSEGVINSQAVEPTITLIEDINNGTFVKSESEMYKTVKLNVTVKAKEDDINIESGDTTLKVGMQVVVKGENGSFEGTILKMNTHE